MANTYFKFKQFTVNQANTAMKVGTDGVLLGAWCDLEGVNRLLDVGTGTGLVALMCAQRNAEAQITAIDVEDMTDARENFALSPWANRFDLCQVALQEFEHKSFDCIVSNPPYFVNSQKNPDNKRATARHTDCLSYEQLAFHASRLLSDQGRVIIIVPTLSQQQMVDCFAQQGLNVSKLCLVCPKIGTQAKRSLMEFSKGIQGFDTEIISIETEQRHSYTKEFENLVREFYLKL